MEFNWDDMRIFLSVARSESLSGAAHALRLDPATVGRRVQRLERALEVPLFTKSPQGYVLTDEGQRFFDHAMRAETAMERGADDLRGRAGRLSGQIRIGAPDGCANYLLPQVTRAIMDDHPELEVQIVALPRVFNLSKREADMAIAVSRPTAGRLTVQKIADYKLHLAASRDYLEGADPIQGLTDLKAHPVVGYIPDMVFDKELDYLSETGADKVDFASNSVSVQLNWIRAGAGIGIVHDFALPAVPGIARILTDELSLSRTFWLIRHHDERRSERLGRFSDLLISGLRAEIARLEALT
ncbi:MAG: LysR family transcriptional regulator [Rhodobacteraceae bacterium]|nr:LysR family transcriptional regulator [Paracoccaceae bacterium]